MGLFSTLLWALLGVYVASAVHELHGMWRPDLSPRTAAVGGGGGSHQRSEHVVHPSWGAKHLGSEARARQQRYAWLVCVSPRAGELSAAEFSAPGACGAGRDDVRLHAASANGDEVQHHLAAHVPSEWFGPFVQLQERFETLQEQIDQFEQMQQVKLQQAQTQQGGMTPTTIRPSPPPPHLVSQLQRVREELTRQNLFLHSFLFRVPGDDNDASGAGALSRAGLLLPRPGSTTNGAAILAALRADPWHVHSATRLVQRWAVYKNHTRNLLSSEASTAAANSSTTQQASPAKPPRLHLVHYLRPSFDFLFVSEELSFSMSKVPADLVARFPSPRASAEVRQAYSPLIGLQELSILRRHWRPLNASFLTEVRQAEENSTSRRLALRQAVPTTSSATDESETVFSTAPASVEGVSDETAFAPTRDVPAAELPPFTSDGVTVQLSLRGSSLGWFRFMAQMEVSVKMLADIQNALDVDSLLDISGGEGAKKDPAAVAAANLRTLRSASSLSQDRASISSSASVEDVKSLFSDSAPWLLGLTVVVALVHLVLDVLAIKNDVSFWRKQSRENNFAGISATSVWITTLVRGVIVLYLIDQENTSKLVLVSVLASFALQVWKSLKVLRVSVSLDWRRPPFFVRLHFGAPSSVEESATHAYDRTALRWLGWASVPFVLGSAAWSLAFYEHRSWYSWALSSVATAVYVGGFLLMTPQLFVNYKLKSVAHLPVRVFIYRACGTFIDDLFAFLFPMPLAHRVAAFRDDVIFFIYLYQRWIYPVDHTRGAAAARPSPSAPLEDAITATLAAASNAGAEEDVGDEDALPVAPSIEEQPSVSPPPVAVAATNETSASSSAELADKENSGIRQRRTGAATAVSS